MENSEKIKRIEQIIKNLQFIAHVTKRYEDEELKEENLDYIIVEFEGMTGFQQHALSEEVRKQKESHKVKFHFACYKESKNNYSAMIKFS